MIWLSAGVPVPPAEARARRRFFDRLVAVLLLGDHEGNVVLRAAGEGAFLHQAELHEMVFDGLAAGALEDGAEHGQAAGAGRIRIGDLLFEAGEHARAALLVFVAQAAEHGRVAAASRSGSV